MVPPKGRQDWRRMPVSVVIPTYNRARLVGRAIDSVLAQSYQDIEILVVDDGSTDDTAAVVARYGEPVRYLPQANAGVGAARNVGVRAARHELIAFLDSDDYWLPGKLAAQVAAMADPEVSLCFTNRTWTSKPDVDRFTQVGLHYPTSPCRIEDPTTAAMWPAGSPIIASASVYRRGPFLRIGGYDERLRVFEDLCLDFRLALAGGKFVALREVLTVLDDSRDFPHLSTPSWDFFVHSTDACVEIYAEALARAVTCQGHVRTNLRRALSYHLSRQAEWLAVDGQRGLARGRAWASLWLIPRWRVALRALLGVVSPQLLARRSPWRGRRSASG